MVSLVQRLELQQSMHFTHMHVTGRSKRQMMKCLPVPCVPSVPSCWSLAANSSMSLFSTLLILASSAFPSLSTCVQATINPTPSSNATVKVTAMKASSSGRERQKLSLLSDSIFVYIQLYLLLSVCDELGPVLSSSYTNLGGSEMTTISL